MAGAAAGILHNTSELGHTPSAGQIGTIYIANNLPMSVPRLLSWVGSCPWLLPGPSLADTNMLNDARGLWQVMVRAGEYDSHAVFERGGICSAGRERSSDSTRR